MEPTVTTFVDRSKALVARAAHAMLETVYPPRCLACMDFTDSPHGLCAECWRETHFIAGAACAKCGVPLVGDASDTEICESCLRHPPAWQRGAAALVYRGAARRMVLGLKHSDRVDMAQPLARWMAKAGERVIAESDLIAPVPLHWRRLLKRRYNQSAELARALARLSGKPAVPDLLLRQRATIAQRQMSRAERAANQSGAITANPRHAVTLRGRSVLVIDDVLTSGATLGTCTEALLGAGAAHVNVLALCRVAFDEMRDL